MTNVYALQKAEIEQFMQKAKEAKEQGKLKEFIQEMKEKLAAKKEQVRFCYGTLTHMLNVTLSQ